MYETAENRPGWTSSFESLLEHQRTLSPDERAACKVRLLDRSRQEREQSDRERLVSDARAISDLGPRWQSATLESYQAPPGDRHALTIAQSFVECPGPRGFWLFGSYGVGKTHLCAGSIIACAENGIAGTLKRAARFLDAIKATFGKDGKIKRGEADLISTLARLPILALDDLDKVEFTPWASQKFFELIDDRYDQNVPLLVTSNCTPADLTERWSDLGLNRKIGGAIADRLREMCVIVKVNGESYRGRFK